MAHTVILTRGIISNVQTFINELSTRYLPFEMYDKETNKLEPKLLQVRVCPIQLWDLSYPKQHRDVIHNTIFQGGMGWPINPAYSKFIKPVKWAMKLKDIPPYEKKQFLMMQPPRDIEVIGIGVKDDYWITESGEHVDEEHKTSLSYEGI